MTFTKKMKIEFTEEELSDLESAREVIDRLINIIQLNDGNTILPLGFTNDPYDISELGLCFAIIEAIAESGFVEVE